MLLKGPTPAPIAAAMFALLFPIFRAIFNGGDDLAIEALVGILTAVFVYFVVAHLVRKLGLPVTASLYEVSQTARKMSGPENK